MDVTPRADGIERASKKCGHAFGKALCEHFGVSPGKVFDVKLNTGMSDIFSATVSLCVTADDLAAIAQRMNGEAQG